MLKNLLIIVLALSPTYFSQTNTFTVADDIDLLLKDDFFQRCQVAVDAYDLSAKEIIYRHNKKFLMRPASNMKVLTTTSALYFLGPEFTYKTTISRNAFRFPLQTKPEAFSLSALVCLHLPAYRPILQQA